MASSSSSPWERWRFALKLASWPKLLVPALVGQAIGVDRTGHIDLLGLAFGMCFVLAFVAYVVLLNDWGDRDVDTIKRSMFPGSSQKTIPDGVLPARMLLLSGLLAGLASLAVAGLGGWALDRPLLPLLALVALAIFWAYTLPPVRLNYRGGGELLEALGVGLVLPILSTYAQCGSLFAPSSSVLYGLAPLALSSALASGLSDERSDAKGGKRTFTTMLGNPPTRALVELFAMLGIAVWIGQAIFAEHGPARPVLLFAAAPQLSRLLDLRAASAAAVTDAFDAQRVYKEHLHGIVWGGGLALALAMTVAPLLGL